MIKLLDAAGDVVASEDGPPEDYVQGEAVALRGYFLLPRQQWERIDSILADVGSVEGPVQVKALMVRQLRSDDFSGEHYV